MEGSEVDPYLVETKILYEMGSEDRIEYVRGIVDFMSTRIDWIWKSDGKIQMMKRTDLFSEEISTKAEEIIICLLWTIKAEFRSEWMKLLGTLVGMQSDYDEDRLGKK